MNGARGSWHSPSSIRIRRKNQFETRYSSSGTRVDERYICCSCGEYKGGSTTGNEYLLQKLLVDLEETKRFNSGLAFINEDLEKRLEEEAVKREEQAKEKEKMKDELCLLRKQLDHIKSKFEQKDKAFNAMKQRLRVAEAGIYEMHRRRAKKEEVERLDALSGDAQNGLDVSGVESCNLSSQDERAAHNAQFSTEENANSESQICRKSAVDAAMHFFGY